MDYFTLRPTSKAGVDGDNVLLLHLGSEVGQGTVFQVDPNLTCHSVRIGQDNISVRITHVVVGHENERLPFPHPDAEPLGDCIGLYALWERVNIRKVFDRDLHNIPEAEVYEWGNIEADVEGDDASQFGDPASDEVQDYSQRKNWYMLSVELYCGERLQFVASGPIIVPLASGVVKDNVLGEKHVGVTLLSVHCKEYFPHLKEGELDVVCWPISCVKLVSDGRFLGDTVEEAAIHSEDSCQRIPEERVPKKWAYHSSKRTKMTLEEKVD